MATASAPTPRSLRRRAQSRRRRAVGEPAVGDRLLDDHAHARGVGARQRVAGRALVQVPGRLHCVERAGRHGGVDRRRLAGPGRGQADLHAGRAQRGELTQHVGVGQHAALDRRRVDLVEPQPRAEVLARLGELAPQLADAQVLDLVLGGVHPPAGRVRVAPLGRHEDVRRLARAQPAAEELLGEPVRARRVEVAHAGRVRAVEHRMRELAQVVGAVLGSEVVGVADVDVRRASQGRQPEADLGHSEKVCSTRRSA